MDVLLNRDSLEKIQKLRQEALVLIETNDTVAVAMKHLQHNVDNVKEILGHSPIQVFAGFVLGILVGMFLV